MKNLKYILLAVLGITAVGGYFVFPGNPQNSPKTFETITTSEDAVDVSVTPNELSKGVWSFEVRLDTHSVELNYDLREISSLVDEKGNGYKSLSWEGDPSGGHHMGGVLKFKPITPKPGNIDLRIDLGGKERSFKWKI